MKKYRKVLLLLSGMILIGGILFCQFVCGKEKISAKELKKQFAYENTQLVPVYNLDQNEQLVFDFKLDYQYMWDDVVDFQEMVTVHTDPACTKESEVPCSFETQENGQGTRIRVTPFEPILPTDSIEEKRYANFDSIIRADGLQERETFWGSAPFYYICIHYDMDAFAPERLKKPVVIPFTVASESEVPGLKGVIDHHGQLSLVWDAIEGAEYYTVYRYQPRGSWSGENNQPEKGQETGYTDGTFWSIGRTVKTTFSNFEEADQEEEKEAAGIRAQYLGMDLESEQLQNNMVQGCFFVTATVNGIESNLSPPVDTADLKLPYKIKDGEMDFEKIESIDDFPEQAEVINIDGSTTVRPVYYRLRSRESVVAVYDYQVEGTMLGGNLFVVTDEEKLPQIISKRKNNLYLDTNFQLNKIPSMAVKSVLAQEEKTKEAVDLYRLVKEQTEKLQKEGDAETLLLPEREITVFADSAEEAWLAYGMLEGAEEISLKAFPALQNPYRLEDVLLKVCEQNPYILGVCSYYYDYESVSLKLEYSYSRLQIAKRQRQIYQAAAAVTEQIIDEDMTAWQKERQIYRFLEENCSYAAAKWEEVKEQNFYKSERDADMEDAVNAYGALVRKEALCQGYAGAFQILANLAGLTVRTANGYLNGNIPHAWNLIEFDGRWYQVDCLSNRSTVGIPYYLYNADVKTAEEKGYVFLEDFLLDGELDALQKSNQDSAKEFYRANRYIAHSREEIERIVNAQIQEDVIAFYYAGKNLEKKELIQSVRKVFFMNGKEAELSALRYDYINGYVILYQK